MNHDCDFMHMIPNLKTEIFSGNKFLIWNNLLCLTVITSLSHHSQVPAVALENISIFAFYPFCLGYHQHGIKLWQSCSTQCCSDMFVVCAGDQHDFVLYHWLFWPLGHWCPNYFICCHICIRLWMSINTQSPNILATLDSQFFLPKLNVLLGK